MSQPTSQELATVYRDMTSEELIATAMEYDSLTDIAQSALRAEFATRKIEPPELPETDPSPNANAQELVIVGRYRDLPQAQIARSALESAGIPCFLRDENTVRNDWLLSNLMGGMRLMVNNSDREAAEAILYSQETQIEE
jgi:hypothetical protein